MKKVIPRFNYDYAKEVPVDNVTNFKCFVGTRGTKPEMLISPHWFDCLSLFIIPTMEDITWQYKISTLEEYMQKFPENTLYAFDSYEEAFKYIADNLKGK